jgi:hypothetical protein
LGNEQCSGKQVVCSNKVFPSTTKAAGRFISYREEPVYHAQFLDSSFSRMAFSLRPFGYEEVVMALLFS